MALLETRDVVVQFGGIVAVDQASIGVEPGQVAGLIGPNGAGKTTTFNVISGLQEPTAGTVHLDGEDITGASVHDRARRGVARTFQRLEVFGSLSVRDNILTAVEIHDSWSSTGVGDVRRRTDEIVDLVGVRAFADQRADAIPTGIARLTELGRALAIEPRVLLLDEPSSGLNEDETGEFGSLLLHLAERGTAILMVEHDVDLVMRVCSFIQVLDFGRVIATGSPDQVRHDPVVQAAYLGDAPDPAGDGDAPDPAGDGDAPDPAGDGATPGGDA